MTDPFDGAAHVQVTTAAASVQEADAVAAAVLDARLAACVQVVGPVRSRFRWRGRVESAEEWLCVIKTTGAAAGAVTDEIARIHSYDTPEITVTPIVGGLPSYLAWIDAEVDPGGGAGGPGGEAGGQPGP
ncbi:MAG TPA: divalent-cation tolerance protein CutA [Acidimicrobiales bacterium]|nr:divalent-cation tolerance protein CutA [Acidimicrobiales bacterium]